MDLERIGPPWKPGERVTMAACHDPCLRLGVSGGWDWLTDWSRLGEVFCPVWHYGNPAEAENLRLVGADSGVVEKAHENDLSGSRQTKSDHPVRDSPDHRPVV